jgi:hypothetical protein
MSMLQTGVPLKVGLPFPCPQERSFEAQDPHEQLMWGDWQMHGDLDYEE